MSGENGATQACLVPRSDWSNKQAQIELHLTFIWNHLSDDRCKYRQVTRLDRPNLFELSHAWTSLILDQTSSTSQPYIGKLVSELDSA